MNEDNRKCGSGLNSVATMPVAQEQFELSFAIDEGNNGRVIRIKVGMNKLASVVKELSKKYFVTIE